MGKLSVTSTILTVVGAAGVIATAITTAKGVPKATELLRKAEEKKGKKLTKLEIVKTAAPAYIPGIVTGAATVGCIFGAHVLSRKAQASLMGAYALLDKSYKEYRKKVDDLYGEDADANVQREIANDIYDENTLELSEGEQLFFDMSSMQYFTAPVNEVIQKCVLEGGNECIIINTPVVLPF